MLHIHVGLLWDLVPERDHFLLGRTTLSCACFRPFSILLGWEGLFDVLQHLKQFLHTLGHSIARDFVLVLPLPRHHPKDVTC